MKRFLQSIAAFSIAFLIGYTFTPIPESVMAQISPPWNSGGSSSTPTANTITTATTCVDAGANDTYACDLPTAPTYSNGFWAAFQANTANTGAATINFNSVGALTIKRKTTAITTDLVTGDIRADQWVFGFYDGTNFQCVSCDGSVANYNTSLVWSASQSFNSGYTLGSAQAMTLGATATFGRIISVVAAQTPDSNVWSFGTTSNSINIMEDGDIASDLNNGACGTAACTDPTINIHSHNQDTQEYIGFSHDGASGNIVAGNSTQKAGQLSLGRTVTLTEAGGAETVITITTATTQSFGLELSYQVRASDVTPDYAIREGSLKYVCVNNATVVTCTKDATAQTDDESVVISTNAKTLTYAIASDVATANVAKITFDIDSDMTVTGASITMTIILNGSGVVS